MCVNVCLSIYVKRIYIINVVVFGKDKKVVNDSTCIMNVAASMHKMPASEGSTSVSGPVAP